MGCKKMFKKYLTCICEIEIKCFSVKKDKLILYCTVWQTFAILKKILLLGSKVRESCVSVTPDYFYVAPTNCANLLALKNGVKFYHVLVLDFTI